MSTQTNGIYWLAGLLEGEGCFEGLLRRDGKTSWLTPRQLNRKGQYGVWVTGTLAVGWMMTLYPLMGVRRQARIKELIERWNAVGD